MDKPLILDRYRLTDRLALGGMAEVWRARDEQLERDVAVKLLHPHLLPDEVSRRRLAAEARAAASLAHPSIVGVYDMDAEGERPAIVMELIEGESLAARLARERPLPPRDAARIVVEVADGLFHAHQRGVVHRDVKPGNILLDADGRAHLVDFGIAHGLAASAERLTTDGTVIGTLRYMAPEQLTDGPIGPRTDLYALGAVLHEALTGRAPFAASGPVALVEAQRAGAPAMPGTDQALASLATACLALTPEGRPLHAGALADSLRAWLDGDPGPALAIGPSATSAVTRPVVAASAPAPVPDSASAAVVPATPARHRATASPLLLVGAIAALALGAAFALVGSANPSVAGPDATPTPTPPATPVPTPEWLAALVAEVAEECGAETAAAVGTAVSGMDEDAAKDYAEPIIDECGESDNDGPGEGRGNQGRGNQGRGDDD